MSEPARGVCVFCNQSLLLDKSVSHERNCAKLKEMKAVADDLPQRCPYCNVDLVANSHGARAVHIVTCGKAPKSTQQAVAASSSAALRGSGEGEGQTLEVSDDDDAPVVGVADLRAAASQAQQFCNTAAVLKRSATDKEAWKDILHLVRDVLTATKLSEVYLDGSGNLKGDASAERFEQLSTAISSFLAGASGLTRVPATSSTPTPLNVTISKPMKRHTDVPIVVAGDPSLDPIVINEKIGAGRFGAYDRRLTYKLDTSVDPQHCLLGYLGCVNDFRMLGNQTTKEALVHSVAWSGVDSHGREDAKRQIKTCDFDCIVSFGAYHVTTGTLTLSNLEGILQNWHHVVREAYGADCPILPAIAAVTSSDKLRLWGMTLIPTLEAKGWPAEHTQHGAAVLIMDAIQVEYKKWCAVQFPLLERYICAKMKEQPGGTEVNKATNAVSFHDLPAGSIISLSRHFDNINFTLGSVPSWADASYDSRFPEAAAARAKPLFGGNGGVKRFGSPDMDTGDTNTRKRRVVADSEWITVAVGAPIPAWALEARKSAIARKESGKETIAREERLGLLRTQRTEWCIAYFIRGKCGWPGCTRLHISGAGATVEITAKKPAAPPS